HIGPHLHASTASYVAFDAGQGGNLLPAVISILLQWSHGPPELLEDSAPELLASPEDDEQPVAARPRRSAAAQQAKARRTLVFMGEAPPCSTQKMRDTRWICKE